jgi:hypothetical protein
MRKRFYELLRNERFLTGMEIGVAICTMLVILVLLGVMFY